MAEFSDRDDGNYTYSEDAPEPSGSERNLDIEDECPDESPSDEICPVIAIGASAGGLEAVRLMLKALPARTGMAYVLVQHLDPTHESMLVDLLAQATPMTVQQAVQGTKVEPDRLYIIPPNARMAIRNGVLQLSPRKEDRSRNLPIDYFFSSLAEDQRNRMAAVVLSGAASDGTLGLEAIKAAGGITFAQDQTAKFDGMPRSAIAAGVVDFVLPPEEIGREIAKLTHHFYFRQPRKASEVVDGPDLETIITLLHSRTGVNFTEYKRPTVRRRLSRRMALHNIQTQRDYIDFLETHPTELDALFEDLLITVTDFFRDPETFDVLAEKVFPAILKGRAPDQTVRIWVAGCSTGKEVYSLVMALLEYLDTVRQTFPIQIFGTDVSEGAIDMARAGRYPDSIAATVSAARLKRFFVKVEGGYQIIRPVRELCIFSRQDITKDPPLAKMDLISCRNLLIYLGPVLQRRVLSVFIYALQPMGCLMLGNSESVGSLSDYFVPLHTKHRLYSRNLSLSRPHIEMPRSAPDATKRANPPASAKPDDAIAPDRHADRRLLDEYAPSGFLVNEQLQVVKFRGNVGPYLFPPPGDPDLDIFRLLREDIASELRSALEEAKNSEREVRKDAIRAQRNDGSRMINLLVWPISEPMSERHFLILLEEPEQEKHRRPQHPSVPAPGSVSEQEYRNVVAELSAARAYMQRLVEDLRSANEEAQSSNEELQSTNEELQTAKEELQSSNEELTTTNEEMLGRNSELGQLNNDLVNLLSSMQTPIVMLSRELQIRRYTPVAEEVLGIIPTDIGRPISDLKPRFDVSGVEDLLLNVIRTGVPLEREVQHETGRWFSLRAHPYHVSQENVDGAVLQLLDISQLKTAMRQVEHARDYAEGIIETIREPLLVLTRDLTVETASPAFLETFQLTTAQVVRQSIYAVDKGRWNLPVVVRLLESLLHEGNGVLQDSELECDIAGKGSRVFQLNARYLRRARERDLILLALEDVTDRKRVAEAKYRRLFETAQDGIVIIDAETGEISDVNPFMLKMLGTIRSDIVGKRFWEAEALSSIENGRDALERLQKEGVVRFPEVALKTGGNRVPELLVEVVANLYREGDKKVAQFNVRDITERKEFDLQLQQTARLESLGILAGGIAHDFNNLLSGILGNAGLALGDAPLGTPYQSALKDVIHASQRAAELTRQMLAYAGKGRLNVRPLDLSELVKDISRLVESSIAKSVSVDLFLEPDLPLVDADAGQMQQVVMNLVINAAESIGEGRSGHVRVRTWAENFSAEELRRRFPATESPAGKYVLLEVADDGSGMEEHIRQRIFDPFFTTKFTGRGLGLAAVQGIVRGHRGAMHVSSALGEGSCFQVLLPAGRVARTPPPVEAPAQRARGTGLILVVDDEAIVLQTTRAILERHGYRVITAANGAIGVDAVREHKESIAAVLLDLTMPVMDGEQACKHIQQIAPSLPVILSSGYDVSQAIDRFGENALAGFLHKPSTVGEMLSVLQTVIDNSQKRERDKS